MKKVFFILVFVLISSFAFANSNKSVETFSKTNIETLALENSSDYTLNLIGKEFSNPELLTKSCTIRYRITITDKDGNSKTVEGEITFLGVSCVELVTAIIKSL